MARNRKFRSAAVRFGPALKALLLCLLIGGSGVGYVWQKEQIIRLDRHIKAQELHLAELRNHNDVSRKQLNNMRSFAAIQQRIKALNLDLIEPQPLQKWRLAEPSAEAYKLRQMAQAGPNLR
jgi:uncharacterized protein HemX